MARLTYTRPDPWDADPVAAFERDFAELIAQPDPGFDFDQSAPEVGESGEITIEAALARIGGIVRRDAAVRS